MSEFNVGDKVNVKDPNTTDSEEATITKIDGDKITVKFLNDKEQDVDKSLLKKIVDVVPTLDPASGTTAVDAGSSTAVDPASGTALDPTLDPVSNTTSGTTSGTTLDNDITLMGTYNNKDFGITIENDKCTIVIDGIDDTNFEKMDEYQKDNDNKVSFTFSKENFIDFLKNVVNKSNTKWSLNNVEIDGNWIVENQDVINIKKQLGISEKAVLIDSDPSRKFKKGDIVNYAKERITITGLGKNTKGELSYMTDHGFKPGNDVDQNGKAEEEEEEAEEKEAAASSASSSALQVVSSSSALPVVSSSALPVVSSSALPVVSSSALPVVSSSKYIIVQTNPFEFVQDLAKQRNSSDTPYNLLRQTDSQCFAIKITKVQKGSCVSSDTKKCITSSSKYDYELDLDGIVSQTINSDELFNEAFFNDSTSSTIASPSSSTIAPSTIAAPDASSTIAASTNASAQGNAAPDTQNDEFFSKLLDIVEFDKIKDIVNKYGSEYNADPKKFEEIVQKILFEMNDKEKVEKFESTSFHGPYGLRQESGTDCFISSAINLMKDIVEYVPSTHAGLTAECDKANQEDIDNSKEINRLTGIMYTYIDGTAADIDQYSNEKTDNYSKTYQELRKLLNVPAGIGESSEILNTYSKIANCPNRLIEITNLVSDDGHYNKSNGEINFNVIENLNRSQYIIFNRTVDRNDETREQWDDLVFPTEFTFDTNEKYVLVSKIFNPLGHMFYVNYNDPTTPIMYNDSVVDYFVVKSGNEAKTVFEDPSVRKQYNEFISTPENKGKDYQVLLKDFLEKNPNVFMPTPTESYVKREKKLVRSALYKKVDAATVNKGGSRKNQGKKQKRTKRNYYVYKK